MTAQVKDICGDTASQFVHGANKRLDNKKGRLIMFTDGQRRKKIKSKEKNTDGKTLTSVFLFSSRLLSSLTRAVSRAFQKATGGLYLRLIFDYNLHQRKRYCNLLQGIRPGKERIRQGLIHKAKCRRATPHATCLSSWFGYIARRSRISNHKGILGGMWLWERSQSVSKLILVSDYHNAEIVGGFV